MHLVDLLSCLRGCSLSRPSVDGDTRLRVTEVLETGDLRFPILLDKSEDGDRIEGESFPLGGGEHACRLSWLYVMVWDDLMIV